MRFGGKIVFFQLTPSRDRMPKVIESILDIFNGSCHVRFTRILPTISNAYFLNEIYKGDDIEWINKMSSKYKNLDLILVEITINDGNVVDEFKCDFKITTSWGNKIELHRNILKSIPLSKITYVKLDGINCCLSSYHKDR